MPHWRKGHDDEVCAACRLTLSDTVLTACVTHIIDGDTIDVELQARHAWVRYIGIHTLETKHPSRGIESYARQEGAAVPECPIVLYDPGQSLAATRKDGCSRVEPYQQSLRLRGCWPQVVRIGAPIARIDKSVVCPIAPRRKASVRIYRKIL